MIAAGNDDETEHALPPDRAFVVQLCAGKQNPGDNPGALRGRVEHVLTGRHRRFDNIEEMVAFFSEPGSQTSTPNRKKPKS